MTVKSPLEESYERRFDLDVWKKLFRYALRYKPQLVLMVACAIVTAGVDVSFPLVTRGLVDAIVADGRNAAFGPFLLAYAALTLTICGAIFGFIRMAGRIRTSVSHDIRRDGFENLQRLSFSFFDHRPVGWLMARMTSDCERLSNIMAWGILDLFWGSTLMTCIAVAMFVMDPRLAALVLSVVPLLAVISILFQKRILKSARIVRKTNSRITAAFNESIMGVRTTKVFVREKRNLGEFRGLADEMFAASRRNALQSALYLPIAISIGSVAAGIALSVGGFGLVAGSLTVGTLMAFMAYVRHFFDPVQEMAHWFAEMQMAQASAERVMSLVEAQADIRDSDEVRRRLEEHAPRAATDPAVAPDGGAAEFRSIELRDVSFRYEENEPVIQRANLKIEAGQAIALVGATGGGKTTLVNLLCRFYEPTEGQVLFDGVDYRERSLGWLQSQLGIVLQTPHLFSGSVAENLRYGRLDATPEEIEAAAKLVGAHDFISAMEDGYDSEVGEGGNRLSTGQKQLISFARAVLARPRILVMDEATSSVDTETEQRIQEGLASLLEGRTSFVIAHRLSTIRSADRILVVEDGRIIESGTHVELLGLRGKYHRLYMQQSVREVARSGDTWTESSGPAEPAPA